MNNIRAARQNAGLGQKEIAINLKVSQPTVSDWENGRVMPSGANLLNLANLLSVSADYLLGRTDKSNFETGHSNSFIIDLSQPNPLTGKKMTRKEKKQLTELLGSAAEALFFDDEMDEHDKEVIIQALNNSFWKAKDKNRRKKITQENNM